MIQIEPVSSDQHAKYVNSQEKRKGYLCTVWECIISDAFKKSVPFGHGFFNSSKFISHSSINLWTVYKLIKVNASKKFKIY